MFYTALFTSKRGPLAKVWLAAHWEKKITKAHVFECNLENTIKELISPQIKIGLRTSGHLLLGVVRIYSRKAKYLLADCNDAVLKIKVAFRPGQTDLPSENLEATFKVITLPEDFTDFGTQLPDINAIEVVDHFSLNQCRTEDITLKEDLGNSFLLLQSDFGDESHQQGGLFDVSFPCLAAVDDGFGDEELGVDFLDFMANSAEDVIPMSFSSDNVEKAMPETPPPTAVSQVHPDTSSPSFRPQPKASSPDQTTLLADEEDAFALEPISEMISEIKRVKRKRRLLVDGEKELSNEEIRDQLTDTADLLCPMDMAPPTRKLMEWKEMGSVQKLFRSYCVPTMHPHLKQLFPRDLPQRSGAEQDADGGGPEQMRGQQRPNAEGSSLEFGETLSLLQESVDQSSTERSLHGTPLCPTAHSRRSPAAPAPGPTRDHEDTRMEVSLPDLSIEDSMRVHPPELEGELLQSQTRTQSLLDSQDFEEKRMSSRAQGLLRFLSSQCCSGGPAVFSLLALNRQCTRTQAAATFFSFLLLKKQKALELHQDLPYADIIASPGPTFHRL